MMNFKDKTAIVTGGTRGIGKEITRQLRALDCHTIVTGTKEDGSDNDHLQLDLSNEDSIGSFLKKIGKLEKIDILINNAGINILEPLDELSTENFQKVLDVNLKGPMVLSREISKKMIEKGFGRIVNISSIWGVSSREKRHSYSSSKAGIVGLTKSMGIELASKNVLVNAVCPGFTNTELTKSTLTETEYDELARQVPIGRFAEVEEIAKTVVFLASDWNTYIAGQSIVVDGGYTIS